MTTNNSQIFDIGMHTGEDTAYYLHCGYDVVAVDASESLVEAASQKFADAIASGRLRLVHAAVTREPGTIRFHQSGKSVWNSIHASISSRESEVLDADIVTATTIPELMETYGIPHYCKVDIEGADLEAITALRDGPLPAFLSVESECMAAGQQPTDAEALATLHQMAALGYREFCLVDQHSLQCLSLDDRPYTRPNRWQRILSYSGIRPFEGRLPRATGHKGYTLAGGSSGRFGAQLPGPWYPLAEAEKLLLLHRRDFFRRKGRASYDFWVDWHARGVEKV